MFGIPAVSFLLAYLASHEGVTAADLTTGIPIVDAFACAFVAFVVTWLVAFFLRLVHMPAVMYYEQKDRADQLHRERHKEEMLLEIANLRAQMAKLRIAMEQDVNSSKDWESEFETLRAKIAAKITEYSNAAEAEIFATAANLRDQPPAGTKHGLYIAFCIRDLDWLHDFVRDNSRKQSSRVEQDHR
jgi:hypothetical protein